VTSNLPETHAQAGATTEKNERSIREMVDAYMMRVCNTFMKRQASPEPQNDSSPLSH
jgi:hypothetical protein